MGDRAAGIGSCCSNLELTSLAELTLLARLRVCRFSFDSVGFVGLDKSNAVTSEDTVDICRNSDFRESVTSTESEVIFAGCND